MDVSGVCRSLLEMKLTFLLDVLKVFILFLISIDI